MTAPRPLPLVALLALAAARPALAQASPHSLSLEVGIAGVSGLALGAHAPVALGASWWLEGRLSATGRLALAFPPQDLDRRAACTVSAAAGLRWDLADGPVRPFAHGEVAWVEVFRSDGLGAGWAVAPAAGLGVDWFVERDLSFGVVATARRLLSPGEPAGAAVEAALRASAWF